jgi:hypothetical protein
MRIAKYKLHYIPSIQRMITAGQLVAMVKKCKDNPGMKVEMTIAKWWPGTTDDVIEEIRHYIHDAINQRSLS